ncbi:MAG TPA: hypothetical protein DF699_04445, partial [Phycisphaerales bacterium]|nr:hypothetical protein [Phycisphaerales bacterium]
MQTYVTQPAMYTALRTALVGVHALPLSSMLRLGSVIGRTYGGLGLNRERIERAIERLEIAMPEY